MRQKLFRSFRYLLGACLIEDDAAFKSDLPYLKMKESSWPSMIKNSFRQSLFISHYGIIFVSQYIIEKCGYGEGSSKIQQ